MTREENIDSQNPKMFSAPVKKSADIWDEEEVKEGSQYEDMYDSRLQPE